MALLVTILFLLGGGMFATLLVLIMLARRGDE